MIHTIKIPQKIWRPKPINKYIPINYADDIYKVVFEFAHYSNTIFRPAKRWADSQRSDIIIFDEAIDRKELEDNLRTGKSVTVTHKAQLTSMIIKY